VRSRSGFALPGLALVLSVFAYGSLSSYVTGSSDVDPRLPITAGIVLGGLAAAAILGGFRRLDGGCWTGLHLFAVAAALGAVVPYSALTDVRAAAALNVALAACAVTSVVRTLRAR
jgi:hypothetical protein